MQVDYLSYTILIAGLIALIRALKINRIYYPFLLIIWLGCLNEIMTDLLLSRGINNYVNTNIYVFIESLLYLWFFKKLGLFEKKKPLLILLASVLFILWCVENFVLGSIISEYNSRFILVYSFILVLMGITQINDILVKEKDIFKNPVFWICIGLVIFYTYLIIVESFWLFSLDDNADFAARVYYFMYWVNAFCNLIFAIAILWMRKRQAFTLQF